MKQKNSEKMKKKEEKISKNRRRAENETTSEKGIHKKSRCGI